VLSGEATNTNFIVFGLTRPGIDPTIYRTRDEHANHYTTDAVSRKLQLGLFDKELPTKLTGLKRSSIDQ
jgi:hypothetical protein